MRQSVVAVNCCFRFPKSSDYFVLLFVDGLSISHPESRFDTLLTIPTVIILICLLPEYVLYTFVRESDKCPWSVLYSVTDTVTVQGPDQSWVWVGSIMAPVGSDRSASLP